MDILIICIVSLFLVFLMHFVIAKVSGYTLKQFYRFYDDDNFFISYLFVMSLLAFIAIFVGIIAIYNTYYL